MFWSFREWKIQSFLSQKVDGKMIFTDYWKALVLNFSVMGNTVFFWVKKFMERWNLLVSEKYLVMGNTVFFSAKKLMERWYILGLFEFFMIFQDLGNMAFRAVVLPFSYCKHLNPNGNIPFIKKPNSIRSLHTNLILVKRLFPQ